MMIRPRLLIVGHGTVGRAVGYAFASSSDLTFIDPRYSGKDHRYGYWGSFLELCKGQVQRPQFDFAFICIPTPSDSDGLVDTDALEFALQNARLHAEITIIKSTIPPDFFIGRNDMYDWAIYNPEFLKASAPEETFVELGFMILGGDETKAEQVMSLYRRHSLIDECPRYFMRMEEAALVKYAINSFLALKVTFFNGLYDWVRRYPSATFETVVRAVAADSRIGPAHTKVPGFDGLRGFGGACLPKDSRAVRHYSDGLMPLVEAMLQINESYTKEESSK